MFTCVRTGGPAGHRADHRRLFDVIRKGTGRSRGDQGDRGGRRGATGSARLRSSAEGTIRARQVEQSRQGAAKIT